MFLVIQIHTGETYCLPSPLFKNPYQLFSLNKSATLNKQDGAKYTKLTLYLVMISSLLLRFPAEVLYGRDEVYRRALL